MRRRRTRFAAQAAVVALLVTFVLASAPDGGSGTTGLLAAGLKPFAGTSKAPASPAATSSASTRSGKNDYQNLKVTVSQTKDLVNQGIEVSWAWSGPDRHATKDGAGNIRANYLQIMQCWGDTAPDRTQCQFGGFGSNPNAGTYAATRRIFPPSAPPNPIFPVDPKEADITFDDTDYVDPTSTAPEFAVPFHSVTGQVVKHEELAANPFYGEADTNEIPFAVTRPDGTGLQTFETQTFRESSGLGCGDIIKTGPKAGQPRSCWLVVVPRGEVDVDGRGYVDFNEGKLQSSPLSGGNWENRIVFPLGFAPIGQPCPIQAKQRPVGGVEMSTEAVLRWQPALCRGGGAVFSHLQLADAVVENGLTGDAAGEAGLGFLNAPVPPAAVPADRTLVYAPMTISGVTIAAMIERQPRNNAPAAVKDRQGAPIPDIKVTPRLVAKLLTQSYQAGVHYRPEAAPGYIKDNPVNIDTDPDFLAVNPDFEQLNQARIQLLIPTGVSYTTELLWRWIAADQEARDFIAGLPDPWDMRVNPFYQGLDIPQQTLPKIDPFCQHDSQPSSLGAYPPLCVFDLHPYVQDFRESARATTRGDTLAIQWGADPILQPQRRVTRDAPGFRQMLGLTDSPTAARFQLATVKLRNAGGAFVAPTTQSMQAAVAVMQRTAVPGVTVADVESTSKTAYPLTAITYAVSAPNKLTADAARDYAAFIRYAAGDGQTPGTAPGTLPAGYAPLTAQLRAQARKAAADVEARIGPATATSPTPTASSTQGTGGDGTGGNGGNGGTDDTSGGATPTPSLGPAPTASPVPTTTASTKPVLARTPGDSVLSWILRYGVLIALVLGLTGAVLAPLLPRIAQRWRR